MTSCVEFVEAIETTLALLLEKIEDELLDHFGSSIEIQRADEGFERIGKDRCFVSSTRCILTDAEEQPLTEPNSPRGICKGFGVHERFAKFGENPFALLGVLRVDPLRNDPLQDGIAEEFEAFVTRHTLAFCAPGSVRSTQIEKAFVGELVTCDGKGPCADVRYIPSTAATPRQ
jgi:hypothetical protein